MKKQFFLKSFYPEVCSYICTDTALLGINYRPVLGSYTQSSVCTGIQVWGLALSIGHNWVGLNWRWSQNPLSKTRFRTETRQRMLSRNTIIVLIYQCHKLFDLSYNYDINFTYLIWDYRSLHNYKKTFNFSIPTILMATRILSCCSSSH
jgi:hypothetical protein